MGKYKNQFGSEIDEKQKIIIGSWSSLYRTLRSTLDKAKNKKVLIK